MPCPRRRLVLLAGPIALLSRHAEAWERVDPYRLMGPHGTAPRHHPRPSSAPPPAPAGAAPPAPRPAGGNRAAGPPPGTPHQTPDRATGIFAPRGAQVAPGALVHPPVAQDPSPGKPPATPATKAPAVRPDSDVPTG